MAKHTVQSVEPNIADLVNSWLKSYKAVSYTHLTLPTTSRV